MKYLLILLMSTFAYFCGIAQNYKKLPNSLDDLMSLSKPVAMDADSVYCYLRQLQETGSERPSFYKLWKCTIKDTPILIYMMMANDNHTIEIYACTQPFIKKYPSTLLLWRTSNGITDWFEIKDDIIYTYKLCDYWELKFVAKQAFTIEDMRLTQVETDKIELVPHSDL